MKQTRILSTKGLSDVLSSRLKDAGLALDMSDFIEIKKSEKRVSSECFESRQILITSQNSVQALIDLGAIHNLQNKRILCVGTKTERMLISKGIFVSEMYKNSEELAEDAVRIEVSTTFFTGKRRMPVIERAFKDKGVELNVIELYDTVLMPVKKEEEYGAVLFFSPSGVESYFIKNKIYRAKAICIGATTEKAIREFTENTSVAEVTTVESVVDATLKFMMSYGK